MSSEAYKRWAASPAGQAWLHAYRRSAAYRAQHAAAERAKRAKTPGASNAASERYRKKNPVGDSARQKVRYAVRTGKLVRPDHCEQCGAECRPDAHHDDYARPLDVRWLCRRCHIGGHRP